MMNHEVQNNIHAQGGAYGPPPGGYGQPPGGAPPAGAPYGGPPGGAPMGPPGGAPMGPPGGAPMAPPGGGAPPGMPGGGGDLEKTVGKWFILSILSLFCGCGLLGLVPIYMTHTAKQALAQGDVATVEKNLKIAKICVILGWVFVVLYVVFVMIWLLFAGGLTMLNM